MQYQEYELYGKWLLEEEKSRDDIVLVVTFRACLDSWPTSRWQYKPPSPHHLPASPKLVLGGGVTLQTKLVTKTSLLNHYQRTSMVKVSISEAIHLGPRNE